MFPFFCLSSASTRPPFFANTQCAERRFSSVLGPARARETENQRRPCRNDLERIQHDVITLAKDNRAKTHELQSSLSFFLSLVLSQLNRSVTASLLSTWRASRYGAADGGGQGTVSGVSGVVAIDFFTWKRRRRRRQSSRFELSRLLL